MHVGFAPGRGPEPTATEERPGDTAATAAVAGPPVASPQFRGSPFELTAVNITGQLPPEWESDGVCWTAHSCLSTTCEDLPCVGCDEEQPEPVEETLDSFPVINTCASASPFIFGTKLRHEDCHDPGPVAMDIVADAAGKNLGRALHRTLIANGKPVNGGVCVSIETAFGMLEQEWEANRSGQPWFSLPSLLKGHAKKAGMLERVGGRYTLCDAPVLTGGMGPKGPDAAGDADCAYLWIHGPVDYALGGFIDNSFRGDTQNKAFQKVRRRGLVRVDPCGISGIPVCLKGGCC